jgi:hypothetical protein
VLVLLVFFGELDVDGYGVVVLFYYGGCWCSSVLSFLLY